MPSADCLPGAMESRPCSGRLSMSRAARLGARIRCVLVTMWRTYWRRRVAHATVFMLQSLDDRTLKDLAIDRSEINSVVYGSASDRRRGRS